MTQTVEGLEAGKAKLPTSSASNAANATTTPTTTSSEAAKRSCDILLNNFQIKKKRYRVLLNYDHIVWERFDAKQKTNVQNEKLNNKKKGETDLESEQLSNKAPYGNNSNIVHINEVIRVEKGDTKSASLRVEIPAAHLANSTAQINPNDSGAITPSAQYLTIHYAERIVKSPTDCNRWRIRSLTLYNADPYIVTQWHMLLRQKLYETNPNRLHIRRLLVFINPYGGRKEGLRTYEQHCKPIFQLAGIDASCVVSQRQNQIRDIIMSHDLTLYDAICSVGGDGTAAEVINGLIFRAMRDRDLDAQPKPAFIPKPPLPIGIIPAGSTDTIAFSAHGTADPRTAAIHVILGQRRGCDICSIRNRQGIIRFCASVFSYGYLGDVAAHSEKYRWMGPKRYEYTGVKAFLANRGYEAEISIMETQDDENEVEARTSRSTLALDSVCYANCQRCSSVISKNMNELDFNNTEQDMGNEPLQTTTSNWTLCTEKSFEHDGVAEQSLGAAGDASDVVDKTTYRTPDIEPELEISKDMTNCDKNLQSDLIEKCPKLKVLEKCDKPAEKAENAMTEAQAKGDSTTIASQNSFSYCSTNSTSMNNKKSQVGSISNSNNEMATTMIPTSPTPTVAPTWKTIRGEFFMISCANITCACARTPNGISRYNHLGDGHLDLILVRKTSMLNNVRFALNTMARNGDIRNLPFVEILRTRQLRFRAHYANDETNRGSTQPIASAFSDDVGDKLVSSWNCDGEVVHDLDVTITSHCQLIDVFMRGPYSYTKSNNDKENNFCCCTSSN